MVQVLGSALFMVIVFTMIRYFGNTYMTLNSFEDKEVLIVSPETSSGGGAFGTTVDNSDKLFAESKTLKGVQTEQTFWSALYSEKNITSMINTVVYGSIMTENAVLNLEKGVQLKDAEIKDGAYPLIVNKESPYAEQYDIGEVFQLYYDNGKRNSTAITEKSFDSVDVYICGILKQPYLVYQVESSNIVIIENILYEPQIMVPEEEALTFFISKDIQFSDNNKLSDNVILNTSNKSFIMEITADENSPEYEDIQLWIKQNCSVLSIQDMLNRGFTNYNEGTANYVIILLVLSLLSIMGISGINLFLAENLKNEYSLYFMCGANWSSCVLIEALRSFVVIFVGSIMGALGGYIFMWLSNDNIKYFADIYLVFYVVLFISVVYLISTLYFLIKLGKTKPINNIRLMVKE